AVMVAPVVSEAGDVEFYLPEGRWTHLWRNDEVQGSRWHKQQQITQTMQAGVVSGGEVTSTEPAL
ncbi:hypothetical protein KU735_23780, partial [Salmonella enterica subsp. enterica serovar Give]|nr:hypothetical protein [Salmonella enterica subsp. enterica serovar Give]